RRIVDEADALAEASAWPGRRVLQSLDAAVGARARVDLSEFAEPSLPDLGLRTWEQPTRLEPLAERLAAMHRDGARVVLFAEGRGSLERAEEVLAPKGLPAGEIRAAVTEVSEGFW